MSQLNRRAVRTSVRVEKMKMNKDKENNCANKTKLQLDPKHVEGWKTIALNDLLKVRSTNYGRSRKGDIKKIVNYYQGIGYDFITKGVMNYLVLKHKEQTEKNLPKAITLFTETTSVSPITTDIVIASDNGTSTGTILNDNNNIASTSNTVVELIASPMINPGGRKKGTTKQKKRDDKVKFQNAKTEATTLCLEVFKEAQKESKLTASNTFRCICDEVEIKYGLEKKSISVETIRSRIKRNNINGHIPQYLSPMSAIEPVLVEYCMQLSEMGAPITRDQVLLLAESLIKGTDVEKLYINLKRKLHLKVPDDDPDCKGLVGLGWYRGFLNRHQDKIKVGKGRIKDIKRQTWCTYHHFKSMYDCVYRNMVKAKVAVQVENTIYHDKLGNVVENETEAFGRGTNYLVTNPENIIFVDECGSNTNQKSDGNVGGQRFVLSVDSDNTGILGCTTDLHFTVLCFNNALGVPLLCAIILKSEKKPSEIPIHVRFGIDITIPLRTDENDSEIDVFYKNSGAGKSMQGGPDCYYKGRRIPCYVTCSPSSSISSAILADMLNHLDTHAQFDRSNGQTPFLLLDGHQSRLDVPFLKYIHTGNHKWTVCFGVPYGTHIWQVADSEQLNGLFKLLLTKLKRFFFEIKRKRNKNFEQSDIIPLVRQAFIDSFGRTETARNAMITRGWNPLNYALLDHPQVVKRNEDQLSNTSSNKTTSTESNDAASQDNASQINTTTGIAATFLEKIVIQKMKDDKYMQNLKKKRIAIAKETSDHEKLKIIGRKLTTGILAHAGQFCLNESIMDQAVDDYTKKENATKELERKKIIRENELKNKYNEIKATLLKEPNRRLTVQNMKTLLGNHKHKDDSPIKNKVDDLIDQWNRRRKRISSDLPVIENKRSKNVNVPTRRLLTTEFDHVFREEDDLVTSLSIAGSMTSNSNGNKENISNNYCNKVSNNNNSIIKQTVPVAEGDEEPTSINEHQNDNDVIRNDEYQEQNNYNDDEVTRNIVLNNNINDADEETFEEL